MDARKAALFHGAVLEPVAHDTTLRERHVVLRNLIILGHVRIEVILAVELRERRNFGIECNASRDHMLDRFFIGDGQRAGERQTNRTDFGVGFTTELVGTRAKHLRARS